MTKAQCDNCTYSSRCDGVLHFKSSHLNMTCKQDRAKAKPKPKPKVARLPKGTKKGDTVGIMEMGLSTGTDTAGGPVLKE